MKDLMCIWATKVCFRKRNPQKKQSVNQWTASGGLKVHLGKKILPLKKGLINQKLRVIQGKVIWGLNMHNGPKSPPTKRVKLVNAKVFILVQKLYIMSSLHHFNPFLFYVLYSVYLLAHLFSFRCV